MAAVQSVTMTNVTCCWKPSSHNRHKQRSTTWKASTSARKEVWSSPWSPKAKPVSKQRMWTLQAATESIAEPSVATTPNGIANMEANAAVIAVNISVRPWTRGAGGVSGTTCANKRSSMRWVGRGLCCKPANWGQFQTKCGLEGCAWPQAQSKRGSFSETLCNEDASTKKSSH